jgi:hypothetical protein
MGPGGEANAQGFINRRGRARNSPLTIRVLLSLTSQQTRGAARVQRMFRRWCAAGCALAALTVAAAAQETQIELRSTLATASVVRVSAIPDNNEFTRLLLQNTTYGNPPGFGAGLTGFISTNVPPRKAAAQKSKKTRVAQLAPAAAAPPPLTAPAEQTTSLRIRPVLREAPIVEPPRPRRTPIDDDPFAPAGVRVGSFVLRATLDASEGYATNPSHVSGGSPGSWFNVVAPNLAFRSEWARHEVQGEIKGSYTAYSGASGLNRPDGAAVVRGRIDVTSATKIELEGTARIWTEYPGSPDAISTAVKLPLVYSLGGTAGVVQRLGRLELGLWSGAEHSTYQSAQLDTGGVFDLSFRDFTAYSTRARAGYDMDGYKPFIEAVVDRRAYDQAVDPFGLQRSSDGFVVRGGIVFARSDLLTGEISAGYTRRTYDDPTLPDISGPVFDSTLIWKASALTTLTLGATSAVEETILAGSSGRFRHEGRIILDHAFRRWLIGSVNFSYAHEDYVGAGRLDKRMRAGASLTYYLNRTLAVRGEVRREWLNSDIPGQDYTADVVMVGVRLQR